MTRFGLLGCGNIAATHADALTKIAADSGRAALSAVYDVVPEKARAVAECYGVPAAPSQEALFAACDAVVVALPSGLHAPATIAAAGAGKHVLTEKPLDVALEPARAMVRACESAGVLLGCISQHRFAPDIVAAKAALDCGTLGPIHLADASVKWFRSQGYYDSAGWRGTLAIDGGGCLMNQGVHTIDVVAWIMGGVAAVQARTRTATHAIEVGDTAVALVEYRSGALGTIVGSTSAFPGFAERIEIHGARGSLVVEGDRLLLNETADPADAPAFGKSVALAGLSHIGAEPRWDALHRTQIEDFALAVEEGRPPAITGREALETLKIVLAIYESARRGGERVEIAPE